MLQSLEEDIKLPARRPISEGIATNPHSTSTSKVFRKPHIFNIPFIKDVFITYTSTFKFSLQVR